MGKQFIKMFLILSAGIITGGALLVTVFCLPVGRVRENVGKNVDVFGKNLVVRLFEGYTGSQPDNFTDAIMLSSAMYDSDGRYSALCESIMIFRETYEEYSPCATLVSHFDEELSYTEEAYSRYWHGYLIFLKPLLMFMSYNSIRILNAVLLAAGQIWIIILMLRKKLTSYIAAYMISILALFPFVIPMSIQFTTICFIQTISVIYLLLYYRTDRKFAFLFFIQGIAIAYFDLLTYPLFALGEALIFLTLLRDEDKEITTGMLREILINSVYWCIGYAGMWIGKWIWGSALLKQNLFLEAVSKIQERAGYTKDIEQFTIIDVIRRNVSVFVNTPMISIFILAVVCCLMIGYMGKNISNANGRNKIMIVPYLFIIIMPLVWFGFTANHSYVHFWFTFRILGVSIFAGLCLMIKISSKVAEKGCNNE